MKLKKIPFILILNKNTSGCHFLSIVIFFILYFTTSISGQHTLQFKKVPAEKIIKKVSEKLQITFNFNYKYLPEGTYSFSCNGSQTEVLETIFTVLDRNYIQLDSTIYTVQKSDLSEVRKVLPIRISGKVIDEYGLELIGATIWIPQMEQSFTTNANGNFLIEGYFSDSEKVEFGYIGYQSQVRQIGLLRSKGQPTIVMQTQDHMLGEIVVVAQPYLPISLQPSTTQETIVMDQLMSVAGRPDKDILSAVQMLPGLYTVDESATEIQMRGGPPDQTNFDWNGIQLFQTSHFYGRISAINPYAVDQVSIIKNGASADRSGQVSGTISMEDHNEIEDSLWAKIHTNLLYSNIGVNVPIIKEKVELRLAWRKSYSEFFDNLVHDRFFDNSFQFGELRNEINIQNEFQLDSVVTLRSTLKYQDFFGTLKVKLSDYDFLKISGTVIDNSFDFEKNDIANNVNPQDNLDIANQGMGLQYAHVWSDQSTTNVQYSRSHYDYENGYLLDPENDINGTSAIEDNTMRQSATDISQSYDTENINLSLGIKYESWDYNRLKASTQGDVESISLNDDFEANEKSVFIKGRWQSSRYWQLEGGIRYSDYSLSGNTYWEPRFHFSAFPMRNWTIHAHWGLYHQVLNKEHVFTTFQVADRFWYLSNEIGDGFFLDVVENRQASIGVSFQKRNWTFNMDIYHKQNDNIYSSAFDFLGQGSPFQFADLQVKGLELSAKYSGKWFSLLWTYDHINETMNYRDGTQSKTPFTQPHRFSFFQGLQWNKWQMSWHWKLASGRYFSDPTGIESTTNANGQTSSYVIFSNILSSQLPIYHSLDISLFYHYGRTTSKYKAKIGFSISNLYNRDNIIKREFYVDYTQPELAILDQSWSGLPITPNLVAEIIF